ncbi:MAG TPA: trypsin-like serine protease, partial [Polyangiaceae bacterium]|nr:trypsin-like serine protease [Polyangiaceae bacterium]
MHSRLVRLALCSSFVMYGCSASHDAGTERSDTAVIGGFPVLSSRLDAIGAVSIGASPVGPSCTGTLIAPSVVLTAEHCVVELEPEELFFATGALTDNPKRVVGVR